MVAESVDLRVEASAQILGDRVLERIHDHPRAWG